MNILLIRYNFLASLANANEISAPQILLETSGNFSNMLKVSVSVSFSSPEYFVNTIDSLFNILRLHFLCFVEVQQRISKSAANGFFQFLTSTHGAQPAGQLSLLSNELAIWLARKHQMRTENSNPRRVIRKTTNQ